LILVGHFLLVDLILLIQLSRLLEELKRSLMKDLFGVEVFLDRACDGLSINFNIKAFVGEMSIDVFTGSFSVFGAQKLRDLFDVNRSEEFTFALEDQDIGLLLDVKGVIVEQEVVI